MMGADGEREARAPRRGQTAAEVMVTVGLVAAVALPLWSLFVSGRGLAFKSKYSYLALVAAREEFEDLRVRAYLMKGEPWLLKHDWQPLTGTPMKALADLEPARDPDTPAYTADQGRVFTMLEVLPPTGPGTWPAVLHVRWSRHGEREPDAGAPEQPGLSRFDFMLVKPVVRAR